VCAVPPRYIAALLLRFCLLRRLGHWQYQSFNSQELADPRSFIGTSFNTTSLAVATSSSQGVITVFRAGNWDFQDGIGRSYSSCAVVTVS
jgi:hypothetical protein